MKVSFLTVGSVVSAVFLVVACGTRNSRPMENALGESMAPKGRFEPNPKMKTADKTADECAPMNDGIDKDLKVGDKVEGVLSVKTSTKDLSFLIHEEMIEVSNSLTVSRTSIKMSGEEEIKSERRCEATGGGKWSCTKNDTEMAKEVKNSICEIKGKPVKDDASPGTYKMANGQVVDVIRRVAVTKGPIECKDGDTVTTVGNGVSVQENYISNQVVVFPSASKTCQESLFVGLRIVTDDGKEIVSVKMERTQLPLRKK